MVYHKTEPKATLFCVEHSNLQNCNFSRVARLLVYQRTWKVGFVRARERGQVALATTLGIHLFVSVLINVIKVLNHVVDLNKADMLL